MRGDFTAVVLLGLASVGFWATHRDASDSYRPTLGLDLSSLREIAQGEVVGFSPEHGVHAWLGIPFAHPPVERLRWQAPRPPAPWSSVRAALAHGPSCPQFDTPLGPGNGARTGKVVGSEDCLTLNVYAPRYSPEEVPREAARRPVMVWIHGGNNTIGDATSTNGSTLAAQRDVVVVTVQYRLGVFGWFSHPALHAREDGPEDRSGNYGTLDLIAALEWVRDNIGAFGGDPERVTVFGESAGGTNIYSLLLSPLAEGLFHRAIVQSGSLHTTPLPVAQNFATDDEPGHRRSSAEVLSRLLLGAQRAPDLAAAREVARSLSPDDVRSVLLGTSTAGMLDAYRSDGVGRLYELPQLLRDGYVLPDADPFELLANGDYHRVPAMIGGNRDEHKLFLLLDSAQVWRLFGLPFAVSDESSYLRDAEYLSLMWKARGVDEPATTMRAAQGPSVYAYRFDWDEQPGLGWLDLGTLIGASHAMEIPFVFGRLTLGRFTPYIFSDERRGDAEMLSDAITSYWTQFAATGDPGHGRHGELPRWPDWGDGRYLVLDTAQDGGIRTSRATVSRGAVIARLERDPRFGSVAERCEAYRSLATWPGWPANAAGAGSGDCVERHVE